MRRLDATDPGRHNENYTAQHSTTQHNIVQLLRLPSPSHVVVLLDLNSHACTATQTRIQ